MEKINTFKELMNEICWSWEYPNYDLKYNEVNDYLWLNKLHIERTYAQYKTDHYELAPGVYEDALRFYEFLKSTETK